MWKKDKNKKYFKLYWLIRTSAIAYYRETHRLVDEMFKTEKEI